MMVTVLVPALLCAEHGPPSPCTVSAFTSNPTAHWIAVDYCRIQKNWEELQNTTRNNASASNMLQLLVEREQLPHEHACRQKTANPWCGVTLHAFCTKSHAADTVARCQPIASLISDSVKLCDCGFSAECRDNQYNSVLQRRCQQHFSALQETDVLYFDTCAKYYNVSKTLAEVTWNASAAHNWTSFAALDACTALANSHGKSTSAYTDLFTDYAVLRELKIHRLVESLLLRCKLLETDAGSAAGPYFAGLMQQWFAQYCL